MTIDRPYVRQSFSNAAQSYCEAAVLQSEVESRLLDRLSMTLLEPDRVVDLGCGPGRSTAELCTRYPEAQVIAVDFSLPMLAAGDGHRVCADAGRLPIADHSVDLVFSSLMLQWCDLEATLNEVRRVLMPSGLFLFSSFGPQTLYELRQSWADSDTQEHVHQFTDLHDLGDAMVKAGFVDPVTDRELLTIQYRSVMTLMKDLKAIGAHYAADDRRRTLTGKRRLLRMAQRYGEQFADEDGLHPATYEVVYGHALGPRPGMPRREGSGEVAAFSVDDLRGSRRK